MPKTPYRVICKRIHENTLQYNVYYGNSSKPLGDENAELGEKLISRHSKSIENLMRSEPSVNITAVSSYYEE